MSRSLGLALVMVTACSAPARSAFLDGPGSDALGARVDAAQADGKIDEALEFALQCAEECHGFVGDFHSRNAFELARKSPARKTRLWEIVGQIEARLLICGPDCDTRYFVVSHRLGIIYRAAQEPLRAKAFLHRVREGAKLRLLDTIVALAGTYPEALDALEDIDAEVMIADVEAAAGRNRVAAARAPDYFDPERKKEARSASARRAVRFASVLLRSQRTADAKRLLESAALLGGCEELLEETSGDTRAVVQEQCARADACRKTEPAGSGDQRSNGASGPP